MMSVKFAEFAYIREKQRIYESVTMAENVIVIFV